MPSKNVQENFIFHWKFIISYTKIIVFSMKNRCFHTSLYIDDHEKNCKKSSYFCSKLIFFDSKSSFLLFPVYRWSKKCCKIVHFHRKFIEKFVIFQRKNHVFTNPGVRMVSTKSLIFHSKIVILIQNPRFPRSRCTDDCIFIQNGMKNGRCSWKINEFRQKCLIR